MQLQITLKTDATFGRGDGVAGLIDQEVEYDAATGLPFIRGRILKGLLVEECANLLYALSLANPAAQDRLQEAAPFLFGRPGSLEQTARMYIGNALLPESLRLAIVHELNVRPPRWTPADVLESLTAIRRQTAVNASTGAPDTGSLRSLRVVLRETVFLAPLDFDTAPTREALALLAACIKALHRGGTGRNRGRGRLEARLLSKEVPDGEASALEDFGNIVQGGSA